MDDQHGHVIDGTARARHWRGSKPKTGSAPDAAEARSDAPKSFAGSLLVPADMLPPASAPDQHVNGGGQVPEAPVAAPGDVAEGDREPVGNDGHQNPFLVPEAAYVHGAARPSRWQAVTAPIRRSLGSIAEHLKSSGLARTRATARQRSTSVPLGRVFALIALAAAIAIVLATNSGAPRPSAARRSLVEAPLKAQRSGVLAGFRDPFVQDGATRSRASHQVGRGRVHRTVVKHRRARRPSRATAASARYTPSTSDAGSTAAPSASPSYSSSGATVTPTQPAPSTSSISSGSSTSSGSNRPAFGQNGTLGPGHSPTS